MKKKVDLTKEEILHLAKLANLILTEAEIAQFSKQLSSILDYISKLNEVDTEDIKEISQVTDLSNVKRTDKIDHKRKLEQALALKNARSIKEDYFKVRAIFKE